MKRTAIIASCAALAALPGAKAKVTLDEQGAVPTDLDKANVLVTKYRSKARYFYVRWRHRGEIIRRLRELRPKPATHSTDTRSLGGWSTSTATWYGPGFYGHSPACGGNGVLTESSWWVATVPLACGARYTICDNGRCVHVTAQDTGGFTPGNFDLTPAVARALGGLYTHTVRYRRG